MSEEYEELIKRLLEIFDLAWNGPNKDQVREQFDRFLKHSNKTIQNLTVINKVLTKAELDTKERCLMLSFFYLVSVEGGFANHADLVCFLLVSQEHDLYNYYKREYVTANMDDIKEVDLYTKIQFLENHNLASFTKICDRKLRNCIAHHDFEIDETGKILIDNSAIDVEEKNMQLISFLNLTKNIFVGSRIAQRKTTKDEKLSELRSFLQARRRI